MTQVTDHPKLYIGIDIHKKSWKIHCSTDIAGGRTFTTPSSAEQLKKYVEKHFNGHQVSVAYEAGCCGYKWHRLFESYGWQSLVVNPADIARSSKHKYQKTDKIDAQLLSRELKDDRLTSIVIPSKEREAHRCLFRRRNGLVKKMRRCKTQIKMRLLYLGIHIPEELDQPTWTLAFLQWLKGLSFEFTNLDYDLSSRIREYHFLDIEIKQVSKQMKAYSRKYHKTDYFLLRTVPGIGKVVATGILAEIGDLRRFKNFKQFASYVGLIPGVQQSGEKTKMTGKTMRAHKHIRSLIVEGTWQAIRIDPSLQAYYRKHKGRDTKQAIFKTAHKLLSKIFAVIKSGNPYEIGLT